MIELINVTLAVLYNSMPFSLLLILLSLLVMVVLLKIGYDPDTHIVLPCARLLPVISTFIIVA